jgi:hypothetical protein
MNDDDTKQWTIKDILLILLFAGILSATFYWRIFGFKPIDNFLKIFQEDYSYIFYPVLLVALIWLLRLSWQEFQKGHEFELLRIVLYSVFLIVIFVCLSLGIID